LAVAQVLAGSEVGSPAALLLSSPWADLTREEYADDLRATAARLYAGAVPRTEPRISPLHGELSGLPPVHLVTGSDGALVEGGRRRARVPRDPRRRRPGRARRAGTALPAGTPVPHRGGPHRDGPGRDGGTRALTGPADAAPRQRRRVFRTDSAAEPGQRSSGSAASARPVSASSRRRIVAALSRSR